MTDPVPVVGASPADRELPNPVVDDRARWMHSVPYQVVPGFRPLELDLVLPREGTGPYPAVLFLHGGGWRFGDRRSVGPSYATGHVFARLAQSGIAVASVDYRLSAEALWPAPLHDVAAALGWLRRRGEEVGVDGRHVAAWGESAGGHLAATLALAGPPLLTERADLIAAVAWYAPSDLVGLPEDLGLDAGDDTTREALLLGGSVEAQPALAAEASPLTHVSPGAPPFLLLHGEADRFIPAAQSARLHSALVAANARSTFTTYEHANHLWLGAPDAALAALDRTVEFLTGELVRRT